MPDISPPPIKLPDNVVKRIQPPPCDKIRLPKPQKLNLCSPFGGAKFQGIVDVTKGIPDDCSLTFSILLQLPPFLMALGCFVKILKVFKPLLDFVQAVPSLNVGKIAGALPDLAAALGEVVGC